MKYELKRIGTWSAIKIGFLIWGLLGFLFGIYMALMMPLFLEMLGSLGGSPFDGEALTPIALIFLPFLYSIIGAVIGMITTAIVVGFYNLISRLIGGIEINIEADVMHPLRVSGENPSSGAESDVYSV